jgi:hypothetical protein
MSARTAARDASQNHVHALTGTAVLFFDMTSNLTQKEFV